MERKKNYQEKVSGNRKERNRQEACIVDVEAVSGSEFKMNVCGYSSRNFMEHFKAIFSLNFMPSHQRFLQKKI